MVRGDEPTDSAAPVVVGVDGSPASDAAMASPPGSGRFGMFTLASCTVRNATRMPAALAVLATLRSISAHRIT